MDVNKEGAYNVASDCSRYLFIIIIFNTVTSHLSCFFHNYVLYFFFTHICSIMSYNYV
jgi:hypothetical protein